MNQRKDLMTWAIERQNEKLRQENEELKAYAEHLNNRLGELMEELADIHGGIYFSTGDNDGEVD